MQMIIMIKAMMMMNKLKLLWQLWLCSYNESIPKFRISASMFQKNWPEFQHVIFLLVILIKLFFSRFIFSLETCFASS